MGYDDGLMADQQVSTSSDISPEHSKQHLKLNSDSSWQPLTNSATEWIMVGKNIKPFFINKLSFLV